MPLNSVFDGRIDRLPARTMTFGNLIGRPDLRPLFGQLSAAEHDRLLDRLLAIDARLQELAAVASAHVGVRYECGGLNLTVGPESAGLHGGPTGDAGDLWFDVDSQYDAASGRSLAPPWTIDSAIFVLCMDAPEPRGESNCHALVRFVASAESPDAVIQTIEEHVEAIKRELLVRDPSAVTGRSHSELI